MKRNGLAVAGAVALAVLSSVWVNAASPGYQGDALSALSDAGPASASLRQADAAQLETCLAGYRGMRTATKCIGQIAEACLKAPAAGAPQADCYQREADGWATIVDSYRTRLEQRYLTDPAKVARLQAGQREWVMDRERRCETGAPSCEMRESGRRALHLRLLAEQAGI